MTAALTADAGTETDKPPKSTSAIVWMTAFVMLLALLLLRSSQLYDEVASQVLMTEEAQALDDPAMGTLATSIGFYLGLTISMLATALYFSLASVIETRMFPRLVRSAGRVRLGFLGATAVTVTVPVQLVSWLLAQESPKDQWLFYAFILAAGLTIPLLFRKQWQSLGSRKVRIIFGTSLLIASVSVLL